MSLHLELFVRDVPAFSYRPLHLGDMRIAVQDIRTPTPERRRKKHA
ncbi:hypothetical protein Deipr_1052 [Deinococcus proteolyticus MRP]|uniref:Uncharacterized protein n=1 Tax=Deinococcus proteolyticus (strain ATCC 35074 / DSM 20540 / JCM 6276 / NBRC 101906 / NCIMB 13154 / VKM Ac-1939 / CCM 2703 / MRP) TaxID=693977 RepID=F0RN62_DEIPM|nr:hypothetical protein [Deinococcus proteolyticus]ADY26204.1 hypothetical protein Deipr_1052 [Deinococcus proteolyticus MRP]